jgi:hypothetical protein
MCFVFLLACPPLTFYPALRFGCLTVEYGLVCSIALAGFLTGQFLQRDFSGLAKYIQIATRKAILATNQGPTAKRGEQAEVGRTRLFPLALRGKAVYNIPTVCFAPR